MGFCKQIRALQGNGNRRGGRLKNRKMLIVKSRDLVAQKVEHAHEVIAYQERNGYGRAHPIVQTGNLHPMFAGFHIGHDGGSPVCGCPAGHPQPGMNTASPIEGVNLLQGYAHHGKQFQLNTIGRWDKYDTFESPGSRTEKFQRSYADPFGIQTLRHLLVEMIE